MAIGIHPQPLLPIKTITGTGEGGFRDGACSAASFRGPTGIALAPDGSLILADADNRRLRKITPKKVGPAALASGEANAAATDGAASGIGTRRGAASAEAAAAAASKGASSEAGAVVFETVSTIAGSGHPGHREGRPREAQLHDPFGVVVDPSGNVYFTDAGSHTIRCVSADTGEVSTLAGSGRPGFADGRGASAQFDFPCAAPPPHAPHACPHALSRTERVSCVSCEACEAYGDTVRPLSCPPPPPPHLRPLWPLWRPPMAPPSPL